MDYPEAVDFLAQTILNYSGQKPYVATVEGMAGIGKTRFCREVWGEIGFSKRGTVTKPHDLEREVLQKGILDFYLIENHDAVQEMIKRDVQRHFGKNIDSRILILSSLAPYLNPPEVTIEKLAGVFSLIVENLFMLKEVSFRTN